MKQLLKKLSDLLNLFLILSGTSSCDYTNNRAHCCMLSVLNGPSGESLTSDHNFAGVLHSSTCAVIVRFITNSWFLEESDNADAGFETTCVTLHVFCFCVECCLVWWWTALSFQICLIRAKSKRCHTVATFGSSGSLFHNSTIVLQICFVILLFFYFISKIRQHVSLVDMLLVFFAMSQTASPKPGGPIHRSPSWCE